MTGPYDEYRDNHYYFSLKFFCCYKDVLKYVFHSFKSLKFVKPLQALWLWL